MSDSYNDPSQFSVERATSGLVLTLYLGAALFLILIVWMVMRGMETPDEASGASDQALRGPAAPVSQVEAPLRVQAARSASAPASASVPASTAPLSLSAAPPAST